MSGGWRWKRSAAGAWRRRRTTRALPARSGCGASSSGTSRRAAFCTARPAACNAFTLCSPWQGAWDAGATARDPPACCPALQELAALAADHEAALAERDGALAASEAQAQEQAAYYNEMLQQTELDLEDQSDRWASAAGAWWWRWRRWWRC
jgi:hypothetical protein